MQRPGDLLHAHILIIPHTENHLLSLGQLGQNLPHQSGGLLPVQRRLRLAVKVQIRNLRLPILPVLSAQLREVHGQPLRHLPGGLVHRNPPQPGQKGPVGLQLVQALISPEVAVLQNIPGQILVPDHGTNGAVEGRVGPLIELRKGRLVPAPGLRHQRRRNNGLGAFLFRSLVHNFHPFSFLFSILTDAFREINGKRLVFSGKGEKPGVFPSICP